MTRAKTLAAAALLASAALCSSTLLRAADEKPDATVTLSGGTAGVGVGVPWGDGTLHYQGKDYRRAQAIAEGRVPGPAA
jgi:hypothetical protein